MLPGLKLAEDDKGVLSSTDVFSLHVQLQVQNLLDIDASYKWCPVQTKINGTSTAIKKSIMITAISDEMMLHNGSLGLVTSR